MILWQIISNIFKYIMITQYSDVQKNKRLDSYDWKMIIDII